MYVNMYGRPGPVVITVPHDGGIELPDAGVREQVRRWRETGPDPRDVGTSHIGRLIQEELIRERIESLRIEVGLHRAQLDVNRSPRSDPFVPRFRDEYERFYAQLHACLDQSLQHFERCLLIDLHGFLQSPGHSEYDIVLGTDSHRTAQNGSDIVLARSLYRLGYNLTFSPDPSRDVCARYRGGWIVRSSANRYNGVRVDAIQIELNRDMRLSETQGETASHLSEAIRSALAAL